MNAECKIELSQNKMKMISPDCILKFDFRQSYTRVEQRLMCQTARSNFDYTLAVILSHQFLCIEDVIAGNHWLCEDRIIYAMLFALNFHLKFLNAVIANFRFLLQEHKCNGKR